MARTPIFVCAASVSANDYIFDSVSGNSYVGEGVFANGLSTVSGNCIADDVDYDVGVMPMSAYDAYYGAISTTYLEYMRGYLSRLSPNEHYVAARVSQYDYIFAYSTDLAYDGTRFAGTSVSVVRFSTQSSGSFGWGVEGTFSLRPGNYLVYSDLLSAPYPSLATSSDLSLRQIVFVFGVFIVFWTLGRFYVRISIPARTRRTRR